MLYEKRTARALVDAATPLDTPATSAELDIANESIAVVHVFYTATGTGKTLFLYPEIRLPVGGDSVWLPALSASLDVSGVTRDAEGYLPLPASAPIPTVEGIDGQEVLLTLHLPVPTGDRFRVRYAEDGYSALEPGQVSVYAAASRGAT